MSHRKRASDKTIIDWFLAVALAVLVSFAIMVTAKITAQAQATPVVVTIAPDGYWLVVPAELSPDGRRLVCIGREETPVLNCVLARDHVMTTDAANPA